MTVVYTVAQMRAWEDAAVAAGGSYAALMENAGAPLGTSGLAGGGVFAAG